MKHQETINSIHELIAAYKENYKTLNAHQLSNLHQLLSIHTFYLSEILADIKRNYNFAYMDRKFCFSSKKTALINKGFKISEADSEAFILSKKELEQEKEFESLGYRLETLYKSINNIISAISQRISILKIEMQNKNY